MKRKNKNIIVIILTIFGIIMVGLIFYIKIQNRRVLEEIYGMEYKKIKTLNKSMDIYNETVGKEIEEIDFLEKELIGTWTDAKSKNEIIVDKFRTLDYSIDNEIYLYNIIVDNNKKYLSISKMQCDTFYSKKINSLSDIDSIHCISVDSYKNRIRYIDKNKLILETFFNDSNVVEFVKN